MRRDRNLFEPVVASTSDDHHFVAAEQVNEKAVEADDMLEPAVRLEPIIFIATEIAAGQGFDKSVPVFAADHEIQNRTALRSPVRLHP